MTAPTAGLIRLLPADVASRIAAGEVIERPVSVVRELLDNAIDARATRITVAIDEGGVALIRITDNGRGIPPEDVEIAFERHATSKIASVDDLRSIRTLGFRGEALPAIAAAGDVVITTRAEDQPVGVQAVLVGGRVARRTSRAVPVGTTFEITNLFASLPARRKFLAAASSEARRITVLVSHYALAYPGIRFELVSGGRRTLATPGDGDMRNAFAAVHGADQAAAMLAVDATETGVEVSGLAGPPSVHRGNRSAISVFVNGRWVQSRPLTFAIAELYRTELPIGRFPVAALRIGLPEEEVDVNVHPAKAEVRFRDERGVIRAARHAVAAALDASPVREWRAPARPPSNDQRNTWAGPPSLTPARAPLSERLQPPAALRQPAPEQQRLGWSDDPRSSPVSPPAQREVLPALRVVGQMGAMYVVAEGPDGMYLIDQHAAHERVLFDRIMTAPAREPAQQPLLEPVLAELPPVQAALLEENSDHLVSLGFELEAFGEASFLVRAVPASFGGRDIVAALGAFLDQLGGERRLADPFQRAAATIACHGSVRAGMALSMDELRQLIRDLEATANPRTCPHGRPTLVHMSQDVLDRQFGRR